MIERIKIKKPNSWQEVIEILEDYKTNLYDQDHAFITWFNAFIWESEEDFVGNIFPSHFTQNLIDDWGLSLNCACSYLLTFFILKDIKFPHEIIEIVLRAYYRFKNGNKDIEKCVEDILNEKIIKSIIE